MCEEGIVLLGGTSGRTIVPSKAKVVTPRYGFPLVFYGAFWHKRYEARGEVPRHVGEGGWPNRRNRISCGTNNATLPSGPRDINLEMPLAGGR